MEELDISCNFEELETLLRDSSGWPAKPMKPIAPKPGSNASQFRQYADELEAYDKIFAHWKTDEASYHARKQKLQELWDKKIRMEYAKWPDEVFDLVRHKAYEDGHSEGWHRVRENIEELADIVEAAMKGNK